MDWLEEPRVAAVVALALNVVYAALILTAAVWLSGWANRRIEAVARHHPRVDATLFSFLGNLARYAVLALGVIFVLNRFGIQTASIVAVIGAAGLAVGLALQGTLSNIASGVMLVLFRPFRVGDSIDAGGNAGTVEEITLFYIQLRTGEGMRTIVPNGQVWSSAITNYSANPTRLVDLTVSVAYETDLKKAGAVLMSVLAAEPRGLADPAPFVRVKDLGESSVDFAVRLWVRNADWWETRCDLTAAIKTALDEAGIAIPFPTRTLVLPQGAGEPEARIVPAE